MSYATKDASQQDSNPILLYAFARGASSWCYASTKLASTITYLGSTYTAEVISSEGIKSTGEVPKDALTIVLPITNALAASFLAYAPDAVTTVTVYRVHGDDLTDGLVVWKGRVLRSSSSVATVTLTCEPVFTSLRRMGLRETYQRTCRYMLFGRGCNVPANDHVVTVTVTNVSGSDVTIDGLMASYVGGTIKADDGTIRMIVAQTSNVLTLMRPVQRLVDKFAIYPNGFSALLYTGCDKSSAMCRDTYHNLGNFGGFPGITGSNPFNGASNVF